MKNIRQPAVAGLFYPRDADRLRAMVRDLLRDANPSEPLPKAIIAPHAGYVYSGPVAASAYALLRPRPGRDIIRRVIVIGPSHRIGFHGIAVSRADIYATVLDRFELIPLVVGSSTAASEVGTVLERLWEDTETLTVISSDLSHYHDYATAKRMDETISVAIERLRPQDIGQESACGRTAINGLLHFARQTGLKARTLDLRNSGDTAGSKDRVVGYGSYAFD